MATVGQFLTPNANKNGPSHRHGGSVFTFGLKGGYPAGIKLIETVELLSHLANVGKNLHPLKTLP